MKKLIVTVDCEGGMHDRCYTKELIDVLEDAFVPATWLLHVSPADPTATSNLYYQEFLHRIPNWHEIGLNASFETDRGYVEDAAERGSILWTARDTLKSHHLKCTAFRAGGYGLRPSDVPYLVDMGFKVDGSIAPGINFKEFANWDDAPRDPYASSADDLRLEGDNKLLHLPLTTHEGKPAHLDLPWSDLESILVANSNREVCTVAVRDYHDSIGNLRNVIAFGKERSAQFATMTQAACEILSK
jgi:hypothetical protein